MVDKLHSNHDRREYFIQTKQQMKSKPQLGILVSVKEEEILPKKWSFPNG